MDILVQKIVEALPSGERYYPKDQYTDQPQRFMVAELIRERILVETGEEVPYASAVIIERFEEAEPPAPARKKGQAPARLPLTRIAAAIYCERDGQKAILIGKGGSKLKEIGTGARASIWSCTSSSSLAGGSQRALSNPSTGATSLRSSPEIRSPNSLRTKTNKPLFGSSHIGCKRPEIKVLRDF
jgi:hypothetical protein